MAGGPAFIRSDVLGGPPLRFCFLQGWEAVSFILKIGKGDSGCLAVLKRQTYAPTDAGRIAAASCIRRRAKSGPRSARLPRAANRQRSQTSCEPEGWRVGQPLRVRKFWLAHPCRVRQLLSDFELTGAQRLRFSSVGLSCCSLSGDCNRLFFHSHRPHVTGEAHTSHSENTPAAKQQSRATMGSRVSGPSP